MGQFFQLINFDSKRWNGSFQLGEVFFDTLCIGLSHWTIPVLESKTLRSIRRDYPRFAHRSKSPDSKLLRLPDELLWMVFRNIGPESFSDAVCLCLADGRLLDVGYHEVQKLKQLIYADCAGDRIAFLGDYTEDFPASVEALAKGQLAEFQASKNSQNNSSDSDEEEDAYQYRFYEVVEEIYRKVIHDAREYEMMNHDVFDKLRVAEQGVYFELMEASYKSSQPWVLCNISKGVYVRADAISELAGENSNNTPFGYNDHLQLDQALLSQISWSSDSSLSMCYGDEELQAYKPEHANFKLHRGPWAGDRFEVTTMDRMRKNIEWKDVSAEIVALLEMIYEAEFGDNWKEELLR
ncbi:hypothetical protein BDW22DRAFT_1362588 [Trametopsis cervina]|nr:hypothetical protein BDW22DRAFT_1362588 [Trametopsis cervina]